MIYSIPAMTMENEFSDLDYVGKLVDKLVASSGDQDYRTVYEWDERGPGDHSPRAVLLRVGDGWQRRVKGH